MDVDRDRDELTLRIAGGWWSVPVERVKAIVPATTVVPLPDAPAWLLGIAWSGEAPIGVIDLAALDGQGQTPPRLLVRLAQAGLAIAAVAVHAGAPPAEEVTPVDVDRLLERITAGLGGEG